MSEIIEQLKWRYAVKKYEVEAIISDEQIQLLKQSIQLSPTSIGLQAYKVLEINNKELREKLKFAANNQTQITDASHLFLFCAKTDIDEPYLDLLINTTASIRNQNISDLNNYKNGIKNHVSKLNQQELVEWNAKQCYISLGFLLETAALMKIDATPMEGFSKEKFDDLLNLKEKGLTSIVACTLGYRSKEDKYQYLAKSRKSLEHFFETI